MLADEPTGNLDSTNSQAILALLEGLNAEGATIVVITHEREIAERLPRQIELLDGLVSRRPRAATCQSDRRRILGPVPSVDARTTDDD